jgi:pentatricopeptide repeat protein
MCTNVLNTAARYKDPNLATDVIRVLSGRISKLELHHYEGLIAAYISSDDLKTALQILGIMKKAGLEPNDGTTRPIFKHLSASDDLPNQAFGLLQRLHKDGKTIPIAAMNVVLESSISQGQLQQAVEQYKSVHKICISGPNTATFNILLQGCAKSPGNKYQAMFLASEMAALKIRPDVLTYDRLILVCLTEDDYEDAFLYLEEMKKTFESGDLRIGTWNALVRKCIAASDERAWSVLQELETKGLNVGKLRSWAEDAWKRTPERMISDIPDEDVINSQYQIGL